MGRLINADALAKNMCDCACADCDNERNINTKCSEIRLTYLRILDEQPTIEERKTGKWIYGEDTIADSVDGYRCDQCGFFVPWDYQHKSIDYIKDYNFCPNCGADMRGEQDGSNS